jgi:hypothetical protein
MLAQICLGMAIFAVLPCWSQVAPSATGGEGAPDETSEMKTPPPVSGQSYPTEVGTETRSNYLRGGIIFNASYIDNYLAGGSASPIGEQTYTVLPTVSYDQMIARQHVTLKYSPGFTFYEPSSALNEMDQNVNVTYQYRLTPHMTLNAQDGFQRSSTAYGLEDSNDGGAVSGTPPNVTPGIFAPFAERMMNTAGAEFSYQFSPVGMVGASGSFMNLDYPNPTQSDGLYNSDQRGGGGFYNRRISAAQYIGVNYQYSWVISYPSNAQSVTQTQTVDGYYSVYAKHNLTLSVSGGPQRYTVSQSSQPASASWGPSVTGSVGWQQPHTNIAISYSRSVTSGGGLLGAFESNSGNASMRWQLSQTWTAGASGSYASNKSVTPLSFGSVEGAHSISGQATVGHAIGRDLNLNFEYDRLHQSYGGIAAIANDPNSDREMISLAWQFTRPLGR